MTCYFRHMKHIFERIGVEVTADNRKEIGRIISGLVNVDYKDCPKVRSEIKKKLGEDEDRFVSDLARAHGPLKRIESS